MRCVSWLLRMCRGSAAAQGQAHLCARHQQPVPAPGGGQPAAARQFPGAPAPLPAPRRGAPALPGQPAGVAHGPPPSPPPPPLSNGQLLKLYGAGRAHCRQSALQVCVQVSATICLKPAGVTQGFHQPVLLRLLLPKAQAAQGSSEAACGAPPCSHRRPALQLGTCLADMRAHGCRMRRRGAPSRLPQGRPAWWWRLQRPHNPTWGRRSWSR